MPAIVETFNPGDRVECVGNTWSRLIRRVAKKAGQGAAIPVVGQVYEVEAAYQCGCGLPECCGVILKLKGVPALVMPPPMPRADALPSADQFRKIAVN